MKNVAALTADDLLGIPDAEPERLFTGEAPVAHAEYRALAARWHPDRNAGDDLAERVFKHVNVLYALAEKKLASGDWRIPGLLVLRGTDGKTRRIRYQRHHPFELGDLYVGPTVVAFVLRPDNADLFENARRAIAGLGFADSAMRDQFARYLPNVRATFTTARGPVLVLAKTPDVVLLRDLLDHLGGRIDPRHAAWILSSLQNLCCYLAHRSPQHTPLAHNAIALDTVFVSPKHHSALLLGGWWYAVPLGTPLLALPARSHACAPPDVVAAKTADVRVDLELTRALGREMLGDPSGVRLPLDATLPKPLVTWLRHAARPDPFEEYRRWEKTRDTAFGPRRFVDRPVSPAAIYH